MITTPIEPALFRGGATLEPATHGLRLHRLHPWVREQFPDPQLLMMESQPSGIRMSFRSTAQRIELTTHSTRDQVRFIATGDPADVAAGALTLEVIRRELASLVERRSADPHLHYLDGLDLFGSDDASRLPLADGLHPDGEAHQLIGRRFADTLLRVRGGTPPFAAAPSS